MYVYKPKVPLQQENATEEVRRRVKCFLVDVEGRKRAVPRAWKGACREEVERKMLHVKWWVPWIVEKVLEVEVEG